jgi:hypothetical protein
MFFVVLNVSIVVVWVVTPHRLVGGYQHFVRTHVLHSNDWHLDGGSTFIHDHCSHLWHYMVLQPRSPQYTQMLVFFLDLILYSSTLTTILATPMHHWHWLCMLACHHRHCTDHLMISGTAHYVPTLCMNTNSIFKHWASSPFRQNQHHQERGEYKFNVISSTFKDWDC